MAGRLKKPTNYVENSRVGMARVESKKLKAGYWPLKTNR